MTPSSGSVNLPERLTELWDTLMFTIFLKDTDKQPDEEIHKAKTGRSQSAGASVLTELGYVICLVWMCLLTCKLSEPPTIGIL